MEEKKPRITYLHILLSPSSPSVLPPQENVTALIPPHIAEALEENTRAYFAQQLLRMTPEDRQSIFAYLEHLLRREQEEEKQAEG